jgi:hypothetical protein
MGPSPVLGGTAGLVIVGGTAAVASQASNIGPILAFGAAVLAFVGALLAAWIAATTARQRQRADLAGARKRQKAALKAEAQRLTLRLDHERALTDVQHLRDLVDEAARLYESCLDAILEVSVTLSRDPPIPGDEYVESLSAANRAHMDVTEMYRRLQLRLREDDPLVTAYAEILYGLEAGLDAIPLSSQRPDVDAMNKCHADLDQARAGFANLCLASRSRLAIFERLTK